MKSAKTAVCSSPLKSLIIVVIFVGVFVLAFSFDLFFFQIIALVFLGLISFSIVIQLFMPAKMLPKTPRSQLAVSIMDLFILSMLVMNGWVWTSILYFIVIIADLWNQDRIDRWNHENSLHERL